MPNWCGGCVTVTGKKENVMNFCRLFIFEEEEGKKGEDDKSIRYFARSFIHQSWKDFEEEFFNDYKEKEDVEIQFVVDFAWSAWSCLIDGYPTKDNADKQLITLADACKLYDVSVDITTEEPGMCFEEEIQANKNDVSYDSTKMLDYECECGNLQQVSKHYAFSEVECYECGKIGKYKYDLLKHI